MRHLSHPRFAALVALGLPVPLVLSVAADRLSGPAERLGYAVGALHGLPAAEAGPVVEPAAEAAPPPGAAEAGTRSEPSASNSAPQNRRPPARAEGAPIAGIRVGREQVLRLARGGTVPRGEPVAPDGVHPGGVRLPTAGALGVGMQNGDIITHVGGVPVRSAGEVVSLVLQARQRRAAALSGTFWRNGRSYSLTVEIPYLPAEQPGTQGATAKPGATRASG